MTSLEAEALTIGQLYRDRGDCENSFDELKNHWGWGGFTTHDLTIARIVALYGDKAGAEGTARADALAAAGDREGEAVWRLITHAVAQLANKTPPGLMH